LSAAAITDDTARQLVENGVTVSQPTNRGFYDDNGSYDVAATVTNGLITGSMLEGLNRSERLAADAELSRQKQAQAGIPPQRGNVDGTVAVGQGFEAFSAPPQLGNINVYFQTFADVLPLQGPMQDLYAQTGRSSSSLTTEQNALLMRMQADSRESRLDGVSPYQQNEMNGSGNLMAGTIAGGNSFSTVGQGERARATRNAGKTELGLDLAPEGANQFAFVDKVDAERAKAAAPAGRLDSMGSAGSNYRFYASDEAAKAGTELEQAGGTWQLSTAASNAAGTQVYLPNQYAADSPGTAPVTLNGSITAGINNSGNHAFASGAGAVKLVPQSLLAAGGNNYLGDSIALTDQESAKKKEIAEQRIVARRVGGVASTNGVIASGAPNAPKANIQFDTAAPRKPAAPPPTPQPEVQTRDNAFSTFSLNVSDVSFKLAAASLQNGAMPDAATVRSEEFINAFDYRDAQAAPGAPLSFAWERAGYPLAPNRDLLRFSLKTAAEGRQAGRALNLVILLDKSGSMERADRVAIIREALRVLATQLQAQDRVSVVVFSRTARLWADGVPGSQLASLLDALEALTPEGGTNLEEAMRLAYETAFRHYLANGENRVVLLTDGAANLGDVEPENFKKKAGANRTQGVALDCFGVGWEDYNDNLLEVISRAGGGRYGFINTPEEAATGFAGQLAGALRVAASDVKVQVEFNPARVIAYRQIGYAKDQLKKEEFRDNTVKAAQMGAAESGNALYTVEINPAGDGPICTVYARYREPGTELYHEREWQVPYTGTAMALDQAGPAMRLAAAASAFSEWLAGSPYAGGVTPDQLLGYLRGVPEAYGADGRAKLLETMIREAKSISGK
jgi:Mg-chelatase subunit ChlD